jgi:transketolase
MNLSDIELQRKSVLYRGRILRYIYQAGAGHTGGSLSCVDILNVLYNRVLRRVSRETFATDNARDRFIQSKGHSVEALFVVLADRGFFPESSLETLCQYQSHFVGHPTRKVPGVEFNTGALGHGLPIAAGVALAGKLDAAGFRVFTLMGDGELAEGSVWEGAMAAAHHGLDNLTAIVDHNTLQISGRTREVCSNEPLDEKFAAFGWTVRVIDGHDLGAITRALTDAPVAGKPTAVIANTVKGKGVSFMEDVAKWHHGVPSAEEYAKASAELETALARIAKHRGRS